MLCLLLVQRFFGFVVYYSNLNSLKITLHFLLTMQVPFGSPKILSFMNEPNTFRSIVVLFRMNMIAQLSLFLMFSSIYSLHISSLKGLSMPRREVLVRKLLMVYSPHQFEGGCQMMYIWASAHLFSTVHFRIFVLGII